MDTDFVHLHVHSSYSFLDGYCKPHELIQRVKELGMKAIAVTDHNHIGGTYEIQQECEENNIKFIPGVETYWTMDTKELMKSADERHADAAEKAFQDGKLTREQADAIIHKKTKVKGIKKLKEIASKYEYNTRGFHMILLAMNQTGWHNLIKLQSEAADKNTYNGRFYVDDNLLRKYNEGTIMTTACIASRTAYLINCFKFKEAEEQMLKWYDIFKDRMYLEVQPLPIQRQIVVNKMYIAWSKKYHIPLVATNDVHYLTEADYDDHDTLLCIGIGKKKTDKDRLHYDNEFWLRTREEMEVAFKKQITYDSSLEPGENKVLAEAYKEAMDNTVKITDRIDDHFQLKSQVNLLPKIDLDTGGLDHKEYLSYLAYNGLYKYAKDQEMNDDTLRHYESRLHYELSVVFTRNFEDYMLIVRDYSTWAVNNGVVVGPGRGSACGSLLLFLIGITRNIDPIKYDLLFERFLTVDRKGFPDIDLDFSNENRYKVVKHLEDRYGKPCVCHIGTYTQEGVKSGLKDVARVLDIPYTESDAISKEIDSMEDSVPPQPSFDDYDKLKESPSELEREQWKKFNELEQKYPKLFDLARKFEGCKRNFGVHASAYLVTPVPITDVFPTRRDDKADVTVTLYPGTTIEELGGVKFDLLGLKSLDVISDALRNISPDLTMDDLYKAADIHDQDVYTMLSEAKSDCVFQFESNLFKGLLRKIKPHSIQDLAAITSLGRPGPLAVGFPDMYAQAKNEGIEPPEYLRGIENITSPTYHVYVYQEQLMAISRQVAGFDVSQSDSLMRKAIAKKKVKMFPMIRRCLIYGKKNCEGPDGWESNDNLPWYDPKEKYGAEIPGAIKKGYTAEEMDYFWNSILGFSSYAFNASHKLMCGLIQ